MFSLEVTISKNHGVEIDDLSIFFNQSSVKCVAHWYKYKFQHAEALFGMLLLSFIFSKG